jgi:hypothetical protein
MVPRGGGLAAQLLLAGLTAKEENILGGETEMNKKRKLKGKTHPHCFQLK